MPDPAFPFLGVHLTRTVAGGVHAGPNAVLALAREGYTRGTVDRRDLVEMLRSRGLRRLARRHAGVGAREVARSLSKRLFLHSLQRLVPEPRAVDLVASPAGVRAQAVSPDGTLVDDFLLVDGPASLHVCNAPSPAATASTWRSGGRSPSGCWPASTAAEPTVTAGPGGGRRRGAGPLGPGPGPALGSGRVAAAPLRRQLPPRHPGGGGGPVLSSS